MVSYIRHIKTPRARAGAVGSMPPHLKDVYAKTLERIVNHTDIPSNTAVLALLLTAYAPHHLTSPTFLLQRDRLDRNLDNTEALHAQVAMLVWFSPRSSYARLPRVGIAT